LPDSLALSLHALAFSRQGRRWKVAGDELEAVELTSAKRAAAMWRKDNPWL
jgi:hypothetical protein